MAGSRSPWRALRPVFLAGAATLTWLTFSASTASADTVRDATSLLGGVTTSVTSVTEKLPLPAAAAPAPVSSSGLLQPVVGDGTGLADSMVSAVPVASHLVPADTVSVIAVPVAHSTDAATAEALEVVVPAVAEVLPVNEGLPVLEPVLQPVEDLVAGTAALPLPGLPEVHAEAAPVALPALPAADVAATPTQEARSEAPTTGVFEAPGTTPVAVAPAAVSISYPLLQKALYPAGVSAEQLSTWDPPSAPAQVPPALGLGAGSGATSAGSSGSAACLSFFSLGLPLSGAVRAGETSEHVPAPVSFDPGSSPD